MKACGCALVAVVAVLAGIVEEASAIPPAPGNCPAFQNSGVGVDSCLINYPGISVRVSPTIVRSGQVITVTESASFGACDPNSDVVPCQVPGADASAFGPRIKFVPHDLVPASPAPTLHLLSRGPSMWRFRVEGRANGHWLTIGAQPRGGFPIDNGIHDPTFQRGFGATSSEAAFYVLPNCGAGAGDAPTAMTAAGRCCPVQPKIAGTARAVRGGSEVIATVRATGLRSGCGQARLSWNTTTGHGGFQKLRRSGGTLTGTARLAKREICTLNMTATVQESDAVGATELPFTGDLPVLTGKAARGPTGETTLQLNAEHLRPPGDCGTPNVQAVIGVAGARRAVPLTVQKLPGKPGAFVARATLPAHTCFTAADFLVRQRDIEATKAGVRVIGEIPAMCML